MHSIRIPEEMDTNLVLTDKLKAARLRKCNMIFDAFNPDNKDTIHLREWELDSYLNYMHHDSANSLRMFFQAFRNQTNKNTMNRKYFIVNILTALDKNKFNLHILFQQDPDIIELEKKMKIPLPTTHTSNMFEQVKERINSGVSIDGTTIESTQRTELPLQRQTEKVLVINNSKDRSCSPIPSNRRDYSFLSNPKISGIKSIEERDSSFLISHESQRDNQKKLQNYLKRHFETDLIDPHSQREISSSVIVNNVEESQLITSSPLPHKKVDATPKRLPPAENHRRKSIPSTAEIELGKCTFEPKLYQPMKTVVRNEIQPKIYDYMLKNKILSGLKLSDLEGDTSFTRKQQKTGPSPHKNRNSESFISLSGRSLPRNPSMEALTNVSLINFGYADAYQRKIEYAQQHLIPDYVELKTRRKSLEKQNPRLKSLSMVRTNSLKTGFAAKGKPPVVKEVHILLENLTENQINKTPPPKSILEHIEKMQQQNPLKISDESLEIRKKYYAYLRNEGGKRSNSSLRTTQTLDRSNSRLSTHESNKAENSFHGGPYLSVPSFLYDPIQQKNNQSQGKKGQRDTKQSQKEKSSFGIQRQNSSSVLYNKNINDSGLLQQNMESKKDSKSKLDMPFKRSPNYHIKAEGPNRKGEDQQQQISIDKENNYHFSFTEKDISQSHLG